MEYLKSKIRDVIDFPQKGIVFKDLTTLFKDARALHIVGWDLSQLYRDKGVTKVVGIDSRFRTRRRICACPQAGQTPRRHRFGFLRQRIRQGHHRNTQGRNHRKRYRGASRRRARYGRYDGCGLQPCQEYEPQKNLHQLRDRTLGAPWSRQVPRRSRSHFAHHLLIRLDTPTTEPGQPASAVGFIFAA